MIRFLNMIFLLLSAFGLLTCSGRVEEPGEEPARTRLAGGGEVIQLSPEQMEMAGIELGMPERRMISTYVECTGQVEVPPQSLASVYSPVSGFVKDLRFLPGDYVRKGTRLMTISHPDLIKLQREFLESRSRLTALEPEFQRKRQLMEADAASQRSLEQAQADFEMEQARYNGLKAEIDLIGLSAAKLEEGGEIQSTLDLYAPVSGFINQVNVNTGKLITPADLLYEIIDNSHVHLELEIFAKDIDYLRKGQRIQAWIPAKDKYYDAEVHLIGRMIDPETKTAIVHGHFETEPVPLTPGTFMHAHIYTDEAEALVVPSAALVREGEKAFVYVRGKTGFESRPVSLGKTDGDFVEVKELEMREGEELVIRGAYYVHGSAPEEE